jgi:polyisoprenoid-binding protein YceI
MRLFRNAIFAAALAALVALPFAGATFTPAAGAQGPATAVAYIPVPGGDYQIDPAHSRIGFAVRHLEINWVEGRFKDFKGTVHYDDKDVTKSTVEFTAKVASVDTEVEARDKHLRTADFFDAEKYPEMTFKSTRVERKGKDGYVLHGDLTLKGVTKPVALPFTVTGAVKDPWGNTRFGVEAHTKINRRDFGVNYGSAFAGGGLDVGNEITINLMLEAMQPAPKAAGR